MLQPLKALFQKIFEPALSQLLETLNAKSTELLTPYQKSHPITYNHYFTEALQQVRNERSKDEYTRIIKDFFAVSSLESVYFSNHHKDLRPLVAALVQRTEPDMNRFACSEALDCMEAYYKVALKRFVDDIAIEVIEAKLISPFYDIFSPITVTSMPADLVTHIAGESEVNRAQREQLTRQLDVLMKGSETCKRFIGVRVLGADDSTIQRGTWFKPANHHPIDEDEGSDEGSDLSLIVLPTVGGKPLRNPRREIAESKEEPDAPEAFEGHLPLAEEEISYSSKKKDKKSKVAARWAFGGIES
ncbi:hypothetical protein GJ744_003658 [Endocarpon pusillum]|uniref:GED domain-containing protein n=1 Tax=Endocarpon pusillum TaxID=364733 RepID=A0A8H7A9C7_9EURO|nr:hypothetical protein GJ744_003658 [Endocarpon pusillum]